MLGFPHPDYLSRKLNARQLREWEAYAKWYGIGAERTDISIANQTAWLRRAWLENDRLTPMDLTPKLGPPEQQSEADQLFNEMRDLFRP